MAVVKQEASGGGNGQICNSISSGNKSQHSQLSSSAVSAPKTPASLTATLTTSTTISSTGNAAGMQQLQQSSGGEEGNACAGCQMPIKDRFIFCVIEQNFHQDCVRCVDCSTSLNERCYTYEGKLYCRMDYWRRFGPKCSACQGSIKATELVQRLKENLVYHLRCFVCQDCKRHLKAGEQLHLIDERRLLCKRDYLLAASARPNDCNQHTSSTPAGPAGEPQLPSVTHHAHPSPHHPPHQHPQQAQQHPAHQLQHMMQHQYHHHHHHLHQHQHQHQHHHHPTSQRRNQQNQENENTSCVRPNSVSSSESGEGPESRLSHPPVTSLLGLSEDCELSENPSGLLLDADEPDADGDELDGGRSSVEGPAGSAEQQHHSSSSGPESEHQQHPHRSASRGGGTGGGHKPTRVRTVLNEKQLQTLRDCYAHNPRPDALMKEQLVDLTGLSPRVIRVWFQNKRCKDKKKSILYKQMQQHEKEGRQFAGLTLLRGLPLVAASPVHYDDQSTLSSTPGAQSATGPPTSVRPEAGELTGAQQQQQQANSQPQSGPLEVHAYQPPWKSLAEYARQQAPDRQPLEAANSPRYQQLMNQVHGYTITPQTSSDELSQDPQQQQQQQQQQQHPAAPGYSTSNHLQHHL